MIVVVMVIFLVGGWFFRSASLFVIENRSDFIADTAVQQLDSFFWDGDVGINKSALILMNKHKNYGVEVHFVFNDNFSLSKEVGYFVPGDLFGGYHKLIIKEDRSLEYTYGFNN